ncbi:MAG: U32 family peptidase, partial [Bacillota bacterium]|nr:U32 family peptidase [Bacillota bacterium]
MKKIELLSPAGDMEKFYAALKGGADAFYLSGKEFGARKFAGNFSNDELIDVVQKSHLYDKKVYVTVNTIIFNNEINEVFEYIKYLNNIYVDGVIVQDLGLIEFCRVNFKDLEMHASTQMSIHSSFGAKLVNDSGVKRVVLARENTLEEIKNVVDEGIDVEVFVHGAHCISYSGQCLMSSLIGGRSGNRGACAQPCRQKYELHNKNHGLVNINVGEYLLSPKDMKTLDDVKKLSEIGVESLKIEGRMKSRYYAFATAHEYHNALMDQPVEFSSESIFNREYTKGRIFKTDDSEFMNYNSPENHGIVIGEVAEFENNFLTINTERKLAVGDEIKIFRSDGSIGGRIEKIISKNRYKVTTKSVFKKGEVLHLTYDTKMMKEIDEKLNKNLQIVPLNISFYANEDGLTRMELMSKGQKVSVVKESISQISNNIILSKEDVFKQLSKLGDTVYYLNNFECYIEGDIFIRKSDLNKLR